MYTLRLANEKDLHVLVEIAKSAFRDDERFRPLGTSLSGPPGHDSYDQHKNWLINHTYLKCEQRDVIVGGCTVDLMGETGRIHGMFVHPRYMGIGIGSWIINQLEIIYPAINKWTLETPDYAYRNHYFYKKNGYVLLQCVAPSPNLGYGFHEYVKIIQ